MSILTVLRNSSYITKQSKLKFVRKNIDKDQDFWSNVLLDKLV